MFNKLYNTVYYMLCNNYNDYEVCVGILKCLWYVKWKIPDTKWNAHHDYKYVNHVCKETILEKLIQRAPTFLHQSLSHSSIEC